LADYAATGALEQVAELLWGEAGIASDTTHRECIHWIVTRYGHDALTIAHYDVLSLAYDFEARFLQCTYSVEMVDARDAWQG
jgi:hypothetical protein